MIGLLQSQFTDMTVLKRFHMLTVDLLPVVAPHHPLAVFGGPIESHVLQHYVQLVLTDLLSMTAGRDYSVLSNQTWRLADLGGETFNAVSRALMGGACQRILLRMILHEDD